MILDKNPPADPDAEADLVAGVIAGYTAPIANPDQEWARLSEIVEGLDARDFYRTSLSMAWVAIQEIVMVGKVADVKSVYEILLRAGTPGEKARDDLIVVMDSRAGELLSLPDQLEQRAERIKERASARKLREAAARIVADVDSGLPAAEAMARAEAAIVAVGDNAYAPDVESADGGLDEILASMRGEVEAHRPLPTGYTALDSILSGGLRGGNVCIVAARAGLGKTTFAYNVIANLLRGDYRVGIFSMEMTRYEVLVNLTSILTGISRHRIKSQDTTPAEQAAVQSCAEVFKRLYVDGSSSIQTTQMVTKIKRMKRRAGVDLVLVDYLQLVRPPGHRKNGNREQEVADISRAIKLAAMTNDIPLMVISQMNRDSERRNNPRPRASDLRESGSLEQDADIVIGLWRDSYVMNGEEVFNPDSQTEAYVLKQRGGRTGRALFDFDEETVTLRPHMPRLIGVTT